MQLDARLIGLAAGVSCGLLLFAITLAGEPSGVLGVTCAWVVFVLPFTVAIRMAQSRALEVAPAFGWCLLAFVVAGFLPVALIGA